MTTCRAFLQAKMKEKIHFYSMKQRGKGKDWREAHKKQNGENTNFQHFL